MKDTNIKFGKTLGGLLAVLMIGICMLLSCKKDINGDGNGNVILDGKRYGMKRAKYANIEVADQKVVILTIDNDHTARRHFNITFQEKLFAELASGTYTLKMYEWPNTAGSYKRDEHFAASDFRYDCSGMAIETCQEATLTSGTVTIRKTGENMNITLEGMTNKGEIKVYYEGPIKNSVNVDF